MTIISKIVSYGKDLSAGGSSASGSLQLRRARKTFKLLSRAMNLPSGLGGMSQGETKKEQEEKALVIMRMQMKMRMKFRGRRAQCVFDCLGCWKLAGRIVLTFKHFMHKVRKIQKFWRRCREGRLQKVRRHVEKRWLNLSRRNPVNPPRTPL